MSDRTYQKIEIVGSSTKSIEDAIQNAIDEVSKQHTDLRWFEVVETRGYIDAGKVAYYQVTVKVGATNL
ncbi:MAG: dodecin [Planctomycetota bacterium]